MQITTKLINDLRTGKVAPDPNAGLGQEEQIKNRIENALNEIRKADAGIQVCANCGHEVDITAPAPMVPEPIKDDSVKSDPRCCERDTDGDSDCPIHQPKDVKEPGPSNWSTEFCEDCGESLDDCICDGEDDERKVIYLDANAMALIQAAQQEIAAQKGKIKGLIEYFCMGYPGQWTLGLDGSELVKIEEDDRDRFTD